MNRNQGLLEAVAAAPLDATPRQVYADWWMEREERRGEYVSAMLAISGKADPYRREVAKRRSSALFAEHEAAWVAELLALGASLPRFSNGFVYQVNLPASKLGGFGALMALEPITHLVIALDDPQALATAMHAEAFDRIRHVTLNGDTDPWAEALADDEALHLANLEALVLHGGSEATIAALASNRAFSKLQRLSVTGGDLGDGGLEALSEGVLRLKTLYASRSGISDEGVQTFVGSKAASELEHLALGGNELTDEALAAILGSSKLKKLRRLEVPQNDFSDEGLEPLTNPKKLPSLTSLDVSGMYFDDELRERLRARLKTGLKP